MRMTVASMRARRGRESGLVSALVRRMRLAASSAVLWALEGVVDDDGSVEREEAEAFPGVGFLARPKAGDEAEAIVLKVGGASGHPVIVATRNQDGVVRLGSLAEDETIVFNSTTVVKVTADGQVQAGAIGGPFVALATKADVDALASWAALHFHTHVTPGSAAQVSGPPSTAMPVGPVPAAAGTQKLKAQ